MTTTARPLRFRHSAAGAVAAVIALIGAIPLVAADWRYAPVMLIPLAIGAWSWRAGTDVSTAGLRVRAALGSRLVPWSEVAELAVAPNARVAARLTSGAVLTLPAVPARELPRLVEAAGQPQ